MRRRSVSVALIVFFAAGIFVGRFLAEPETEVWAEAEPPCVDGDLNGDRAVDVSDAVWLLRFLFAAGPPPPPCSGPVTTVILVRHADRDTIPKDCPDTCPDGCINEAGRERAARLAAILADAEIDLLLGSDLCRTWETLQPTADARGLPIEMVRLPEDVAARVRELPPGSTAVIAHHSFTLHDILIELGLDESVRDIPVRGDNYDNFLVIELPARGVPELLRLHY